MYFTCGGTVTSGKIYDADIFTGKLWWWWQGHNIAVGDSVKAIRTRRGDEPVEVEVVAVEALSAVAVLRRRIGRVFGITLGKRSGAVDEIPAAISVVCASSSTVIRRSELAVAWIEPLVGGEALAAVVDELVVLTTGCHCKEECEPYPHLARRFAAGQPLRLR